MSCTKASEERMEPGVYISNYAVKALSAVFGG